jgi:acetyl esterase/lipase
VSVLRYAGQVAEVSLPPGPVAGVLLLIHGGFWREAYDRHHLDPLASSLTEHRLAVVTPEYRRVGGGGGVPMTFDDIRAACAELPGLLARAVPATGEAPWGLAGHSAGGHLALWAAAICPPRRLTQVIGLAAVSDLVQADRDGLGRHAARDLMGGPPDERWASADPTRLPTPQVPVTLIHGTRDDVVPIGQAYSYQHAHPATKVITQDVGHFELIDPTSPASLSSLWPALSL